MSRQGYYSVLQYLPFPERFEFVNVGVVVFAPEAQSIEIIAAPDYARIAKLFGKPDKNHLRASIDSIARRLNSEFGKWSRESVSRFAAMRAGKIQMSAPLPILIDESPATIAAKLFDEMVAETPKQVRASQARVAFKKRLEGAGVIHLVDSSPAPVTLPQGVTIKVPFAYQNGAYNLIDPVRLAGPVDEALKNASARAIEGRWLFEHSNLMAHPQRLVVVGDLSSQSDAFASSLEKVMRENEVRFYDFERVDELIDDIRRHSPSLPAASRQHQEP
jgi:hypothetical protein